MQALRFAAALYARRLDTAFHGYLRRDPMSRLRLRPGRDDPYTIYEQIRDHGDLPRTRLGNYATASHPLCNTILRDRRFGVRNAELTGRAVPDQRVDMSFLDRDPPDHTRLRRLAQPAFSPRRMAGYRTLIEERTHALLDRAADESDLVSAFAAPLPIAVITELLGIPDADAGRFARHGATIGSALDGIRSLRHGVRVKAAGDELDGIFAGLFTLRRHEPADDLVSRLVAAEGDQVDPGELLPMCRLLLVAGFETTVNLIGNTVTALLDHPQQWADLCADPAGLAAAAVEETLRWDPPVQRTARCALEDVELAGRTVRTGQFVITLLAGANRDPAVFTDPGRFDIHRTPEADHLAFSSGIHYCVGAPLARLEAITAIRVLAERAPGLRRTAPVRRRSSGVIRGPIHLPVRGLSRASRGPARTSPTGR